VRLVGSKLAAGKGSKRWEGGRGDKGWQVREGGQESKYYIDTINTRPRTTNSIAFVLEAVRIAYHLVPLKESLYRFYNKKMI
jgi:hypothetical protein